ncbi:MAG TPA: hypothetical protein VFI65_26305 [Streptosporangiaceae bacterium]|nr:hypothetical protein [Streptosporangiaceae bacterium]
MDRLTRGLIWLLGGAERLLPPSRRQWIEAVRAETEQVPAGWTQLSWLAGGLWLVFREANMARKIGYWLGVGAVAVIAAWTAWLSLRTAPASDVEAVTDRFRILVGLTALVGLPWLARRQGVFGPVGPSVLARFVRIAGCGAVCGVGLLIVNLDLHANGNGLGTGGFSPAQEFTGLAALAAAVLAPYAVKAKWPNAERDKTWAIAACAATTALVLIPLQAIPVAYLMLIMAATSRRSPVRSTTLIAGTIGGLAYFLSLIATPIIDNGLLILLLIVAATLLCTMLGGAGAAWLMTGTADADDLRAARVRQGMYAGIAAGAIGGLVLALSVAFFGIPMALGPLVGIAGGRLGAALAADHLPRRRGPDRSLSFGLYVSD